jgi:transaldolase
VPRLYVDSADTSAVERLLADRLIAGVTTNPTILERSGRAVADIPALYDRWVAQGAGEVFFQAWGDDLLAEGRRIAALGPRAVVKVPATREGFAASAALVADGVPVLLTAVYSAAQALAAATVGVRYIAPYLGRLDDAGRDGTAEIATMQRLVDGSATTVLAASLRSPEAIVGLALVGVECFTAAPDVLDRVFRSVASDAAAADFESAVTRSSAAAGVTPVEA